MTGRRRALRAGAQLAGIAAVRTALVVASSWAREALRPRYREAHVWSSPGSVSDGARAWMLEHSPAMAPVPLGSPVGMYGDPGHGVSLRADPGPGPAAFVVLVRNIEARPLDGSFAGGGAWLDRPASGPSG